VGICSIANLLVVPAIWPTYKVSMVSESLITTLDGVTPKQYAATNPFTVRKSFAELRQETQINLAQAEINAALEFSIVILKAQKEQFQKQANVRYSSQVLSSITLAAAMFIMFYTEKRDKSSAADNQQRSADANEENPSDKL